MDPSTYSTSSTRTTSSTGGSALSTPTWIALVLVFIGALNWGLVGLFSFDLVAAIFGDLTALSRVIYVLVALAGVYLLAVAAARLVERPRARGAT